MRIVPGELNLMSAGSGIVHSERSGADIRRAPSRLFGIQSWLAQPHAHENGSPSFVHHGASDLPRFSDGPVSGRVIMGSFHGVQSPVQTDWETLYVDLRLAASARLKIPSSTEERALYALDGELELSGERFAPQQMIVLRPGVDIELVATQDTRVMLLGGAAMDGPRHIWWNFVSSDLERMEQAKRAWDEGRFPVVPGDEEEFIPLPTRYFD